MPQKVMLLKHGLGHLRHFSRRGFSTGTDSDRELLSRLKNILVTGSAGGTGSKGDPLLTRLKRILINPVQNNFEKGAEEKVMIQGSDESEELPPHASIIEVFCKTGKFEEAYKGALAMLSQGLELDGSVLTTLLYGLYKCGYVMQSMKLAKEIIVRGQTPVVRETFQGLLQQDVLFHSTLVEGLCRAGKSDEAYSVFTSTADRMSYNHTACSTLADVLDDLGRGEEVFQVAVYMLRKGIRIRSRIFSSIIGRLCDAGLQDLLLKACFRDNFSTLDHKAVLFELCIRGKVDEASQFLVDMAESDTQTFLEAVPKVCDAIIEKGDYGLMTRLTRSSRLNHTAATYNVLICALCKCNKVEEAYRMLTEMRDRGFEPDSNTLALLKPVLKPVVSDYSAPVKQLIREGMVEEALELYTKVLSAGSVLKLEIASYNALLRQLWFSGKENEAFRVFQHIARSGLVPDATTCDILVTGLCSVDKADAAFKILQSMRALSCVADQRTFDILLSTACRGDDVELLELVVTEMHDCGLLPDYDTAFVCYSRRGRLAEMQRLFIEMIGKGHQPSDLSYQLVVGGLCEAEKLDSAWDVVQQVEKAGYSLKQGAYRPYIVGLLKAGKVEQAKDRSSGMDSAFLLHCYVEAGLVAEACGHYRKMVEEGCECTAALVDVICSCRSGAVAVACKLLNGDSLRLSKVVQVLVKLRRLDEVVELLVLWTTDEKVTAKTWALYDELIMDMCKVERFEEAALVLKNLFARGLLAKLAADVG